MGCLTGAAQLIDNILQLLAQEYGNDGWRCLVCAQTVIVTDVGCRFAKQVCVVSTAFKMQARTRRNWMFRAGVSPGFNRFMPSSEVRDQLLCLPEPFTPAKGFS